ncbi:hypothetical protein [Actinoallomurus sp. NPDC052274]|uniref:aggregation-promoting factor C-terminal-like domain-containing protein n=1 Tax=Actinoallomurus sp. NPDC052274 TaxID=3155420 RepID=UPI0034404287
MAEGFRVATAYVEVVPDTEGFPEKVKTEIERDQTKTKVLVDPDATGFREKLKAAIDSVGEERIRLGADPSAVERAVTEAKAIVDTFTEEEARARLGVDKTDFDAGVEEARVTLDDLGAKDVHPRIRLDDAGFKEAATADAAAADNAASHISLLGGAIAGLAIAAPSAGGLLGALAGVGATVGLSFSGVRQALTDATAAQNAMGQSAAQVAATELANSIAIRNAEQAITDAKRAAAQQAIQAAEAVASAEQGLQNAIISEQMAQRALTQARRDAALQLEELNNQEKDAALSAEAARIALEQARINQQQVNASNASTALQRAQADLAVRQAQQALTEAQQRATHATEDAARANKAGVEGSPQVVQAKNSERLALQGVENAHRALADAQRAAANAQIASSEAVRKATQSLADIQRQQALQAQITAEANGQAAAKFARDMAGMTAAGRDFVRQLLGMRGELHNLSSTAQTNFLPGVTKFLRDSESLLPTVNREIAQMGGILSGQFSALGNVIRSSGFHAELQRIFAQGNQMVSVLGPAIGRMAEALLHMFSVSGAASAGLTRGLAAIANGFSALFKAMEPAAGSVGVILSTLGQAVGSLGRPLGQVISALADALAPTLAALLPGFRALASALGAGLSVAIRGLTPLLTLAARAISEIAVSISPVLPILGKLIAQLAGALSVALKPLLPVVQTLARTLGRELSLVLPPVIDLFASLIKSTTPLFGLLEPVGKLLASLALQLAGPLAQAIGQLTPSLTRMVTEFVNLLVKALPPLLPVIQRQLIPAWVQMFVAITPLLPQLVELSANLTVLALRALPLVIPALVLGIKIFAQLEMGLASLVTWLAHMTSGVLKMATTTTQSWGTLWTDTKKTFDNVYTYLKRIWDVDIKGVFSGAFSWLRHTWRDTTDWLSNLWKGWLGDTKDNTTSTLDSVTGGVTDFFSGLKRIFQSGVSALGQVWKTLQDTFKTPVNFLISTVYMGGIRKLWDAVVDHIGMKNLDLPEVHALNAGGVVPGPDQGGVVPGPDVDADIVPTLLTPGERVLSRKQVSMLGGHRVIDAMVGRTTGASDAHHFAGGGIVGDLFGGLEKVIGGAEWMTNFMLHPSEAMQKLLGKVVSTNAQGDLAKMMTGVPTELIKDLAKYIASAGMSGGAMAMVNLAKAQVGYHEGPNNSNMYSAGLGRPAEQWCADFIDWLAKQTGNASIFPQNPSAPGMAQGFGRQFQTGSAGILPGDIVFYSGESSGWGGIGHVGIAVSGGGTGGWQSVEGNYGDRVALVNRGSAQGHARPKYPVTNGPGGSLIHAAPATAKSWAQQALMSYGWGTPDQYNALIKLWDRESGWRWNALNPSSGAYGIPQSLPASKMSAAGADWHDNAATQMRWGLNYIQKRYHSPANAWGHEVSAGWYDQGGYLPPGMSAVMNATGQPEAVLDPRQTAALERLAEVLTGLTGGVQARPAVHQENHFHGGPRPGPEELAALQLHLATAIGNS